MVLDKIEINNRPIAVHGYWVVNNYVMGNRTRVCNLSWATGQNLLPQGNILPLVDIVYYVCYYWLLIYSQLPKLPITSN